MVGINCSVSELKVIGFAVFYWERTSLFLGLVDQGSELTKKKSKKMAENANNHERSQEKFQLLEKQRIQ